MPHVETSLNLSTVSKRKHSLDDFSSVVQVGDMFEESSDSDEEHTLQ